MTVNKFCVVPCLYGIGRLPEIDVLYVSDLVAALTAQEEFFVEAVAED